MSIDLTPRPALAARIGTLVLLLLSLQMPVAAQSITYIHADALGTPIAVTDSDRNVVEVSEYEPYGKLLNRSLTDAPGFTGHVSDAATGLSYMQQRYYDPGIGRFLSVDPVTANTGTGANFNRYWYANNNPYRFTDPDGRIPVETIWDAANVAMGISSAVDNFRQGNIGAGVVDSIGVIADVAATAIPYVPGGAAAAIGAVRTGAKAGDKVADPRKPLAGTGDWAGAGSSRHTTTGEGGLPGAVDQFKVDRKPGETLSVQGGRRANGEGVKIMGSQGTNLRLKPGGKVSVDSPSRGTKPKGETTHYDDTKRNR